ncbi:MAG: hypothetical protein NZ853_01935 [Leptospiraceae bacterium]|nr:hypothetical protein [Leptospiraceae bacterium]MDW7976014.1 hypothetical protein [Leptospiraceae bacterium]
MRFILFWLLILFVLTCKKPEDKAKLSIFGLNLVGNFGNYYYFEGEIDKEISPYCGEVKKKPTSESSKKETSPTQYDIDSFLQFKWGDYVQLRFTYDPQRKKFSLTPTTTAVSICKTSDFINCNPNGTAQCETADGIKCGGTKTFIFVGVLNPFVFQAVSGTIDWSKGFILSSDDRYVQRANLEFFMVDKDRNVLEGRITCNSKF